MSDSPTDRMARQNDDDLAPGVLQVLQLTVTLRFLVFVLGGLMFGPRLLFDHIGVLAPLALFDSLVLLVLVFWPVPRRWLGKWFLPIVLAWFLLAPLIQQMAFHLWLDPSVVGRFSFRGILSPTFMLLWLTIPVVLIARQYGRRGFWIAMACLLAVDLVILWLGFHDPEARFDLLFAGSTQLISVFILGLVVTWLVEAQQAEQRALEEANRKLAQRAATIEQLAESRERNRLARDLHDTLAHAMSGLGVQLQALETLMVHDPDAALVQLHQVQAIAKSGMQESRRAIDSLRATPLEDLGLSEALRQLCRRQAERTGISITCKIAEAEALDPLTEQTFYRVAEAALANIDQHSAASNATVDLGIIDDGSRLRLVIQDDGVGFDVNKVAQDRYGLSGMAERAALVGVNLAIDSAPQQGTTVSLETDLAGGDPR
ncbi:MAG: sensor histidine kinase [Chloroflexota bacterium]|nr:sensor histidine kinase [Chloroflexota bacterium]